MNRIYAHIVIVMLLLAATAGGYGFWYLQVGEAGSRIAVIDAELAAKNEELKQIQEARSALAALSEKEARIRSYFVEGDGVVPFIEEVGRIGSSLGAKVEVLGVAEEQGRERGSIELSLRIEGTFDAVMRTVGALEYAPYDITLTRLAIDAVSQDELGSSWAEQAAYTIGTRTP
jgi:hypothetical protein